MFGETSAIEWASLWSCKRIEVSLHGRHPILGWVFFRADNLTHAVTYLGSMVGRGSGANQELLFFLNPYYSFILMVALLFALPLRRWLHYQVLIRVRSSNVIWTGVINVALTVGNLTLLLWALIELSQNSYNPFIYFRF